MVELFANSGDPDQTPHSAASDMGLHCLPVTRSGVSSLQWVKVNGQDVREKALLSILFPFCKWTYLKRNEFVPGRNNLFSFYRRLHRRLQKGLGVQESSPEVNQLVSLFINDGKSTKFIHSF